MSDPAVVIDPAELEEIARRLIAVSYSGVLTEQFSREVRLVAAAASCWVQERVDKQQDPRRSMRVNQYVDQQSTERDC